MTLKDVLPVELTGGEYHDTRAFAMKDVEVVREHHRWMGGTFKEWPGVHVNVHYWFDLANGYSVAHNENPSTGWSFPVIKTAKV